MKMKMEMSGMSTVIRKNGINFKEYDWMMLSNIGSMDATLVAIMKGDIHDDASNSLPIIHSTNPKKSKRADRRKQSFHKREQRVNLYRNKGYKVDNLSPANIGKLSEGEGNFPTYFHQERLYNKGQRDKKKMVPIKDILFQMEVDNHQQMLEEQEAKKAEDRRFLTSAINEMMVEIDTIDATISYSEAEIDNLLSYINGLHDHRAKLMAEIKRLKGYLK